MSNVNVRFITISGSVNDWSSNFRRKGCGRAMSGGGGGWGGGSSSMHMYYSKVFMYPVHVPSDEILWKIMLLQTSLLFSFVHRNIITHRQPYGVQWKESIVHATREGKVHIGPVVACKKKNRALEASKVRDVSFLHFRLERNTSDCVYFLPEARHLL